MRERKLLGLVLRPATVKLATHSAMGAAMGLALALLLRALDPSLLALLARQGHSAIWIVVGILVLVFAAGATLTGLLFLAADGEI
jgi:hypothetical protein